MVAKGALGKYTPGKPSTMQYTITLITLLSFSIIVGHNAAIQPIGQWRYFSYHPLFMTIGMVGFMGSAAITKKLGGYTNTKIHAILSWLGVFTSSAGFYVIYQNKEMNHSKHLTSYHSWSGILVLINCIALGLVGSIVLHPDFGIDKTNKTIRLAHKMFARMILVLAWATSLVGLYQMNVSNSMLAMYGIPLLCLIPVTLM